MIKVIFGWVTKGHLEWNAIDNLMFWLFIIIIFIIIELIKNIKENKKNKKHLK